ncbi:MAG: hypothetical protein ACREON_07015 [Gemmatimonadaceae bacterium]
MAGPGRPARGDPLTIAARYESAAREWDVMSRSSKEPHTVAVCRRQADALMEKAAAVLARAEGGQEAPSHVA